MFLGHRRLEATLTFYAQFIDNTGAASNVDAGAPAYTIYEEETAAAILAGAMTQQGGWGAGLYSEQVTLLAASGFEAGKDYVIRITGTIDGVTPAALHHFQVGPVPANTIEIHDDAPAAAALESILDGTGATMTLDKVRVDAADLNGGVEITNTLGDGIRSQATGGNGHGAQLVGEGSGNGLLGIGGLTGRGIDGRGGATSGEGIRGLAQGGNSSGVRMEANGTGAGAIGASPGGSGFVGLGIGGEAFRADPGSGAPLSADIVLQIVAQVWNELIALHLGVGSTGEALNNAATGAGPAAAIAAAVWNTLKAAHQGQTIFGNVAEDLDNLQFRGSPR